MTAARPGSLISAAPARLAIAVALIAVAFHWSLGTLLRDWRYSTPTSDLALVPLLAVALLVAATLRHRHVGAIRLGRLDLVVAVPCILLALAASAVAPVTMSAYYWPARLDLLALPLFAAAAVAILFGTRALAAYAFPLAFLALAWPLPLTVALESTLGALTSFTGAAVTAALAAVPVAERAPGAGDPVFLVGEGAGAFAVSVASACSGAEGLVGYGVVAAALLYLLRGPFSRRLAWVAAGLALAWVANVVRIVAILAAGRFLGEDVAIEGLHPVAGLVAVNVTLVVMLALLGRFGLARRPLRDSGHADSPMSRAVAERERATPSTLAFRIALVALPALVLGFANGDLARADDAYAGDGLPAAHAFSGAHDVDGAWSAEKVATYGWARAYFGDDSSWTRYRLSATGAGRDVTVWADALVTSDLGALVAHPVRRCYDFHRQPVSVDQRVSLAAGVVGRVFVYEVDGARWHALSWEWPVRSEGGLRHERMTLLASSHLTAGEPPAGGDGGVVAGRIVAALNSLRPDEDDNRALTASLRSVADAMIARRVSGQAA